MPLDVKKVATPDEKFQFIRLPWKIYQDHPFWVPPLISERKKFLDPKINPFFKHAEVDLFMVRSKNREPVGRIALILDRDYNTFHSENTGFFGLFESVNDPEVSGLLLDTALAWVREKGLDKILGPMSLSTNHECGLLVEGFDSPPMIGIPYNPPYYRDLFERWGLAKARDLLSLKLDMIKIPDYLESAVARLKERNRFTLRPLRLDRFDKEIEIMWDVYNSAWEKNWGFVPMNRDEFVFSAHEMKQIIRPEFCYIAEVKGEPAGFSLTLPDVNQVLKSLNGRLFPLGWARFLWNKKHIDVCRVIALGVKKKFRRLGIEACFNHQTYTQALARNIPWLDMSWVLEDNTDILTPIHRIGGRTYKRHRIYERASAS